MSNSNKDTEIYVTATGEFSSNRFTNQPLKKSSDDKTVAVQNYSYDALGHQNPEKVRVFLARTHGHFVESFFLIG